jgi:hypothetical protein
VGPAVEAARRRAEAMKLRRVRFTVRRLIVLVAVVAVAFGVVGEPLRRRWRFEKIARYHNAIFQARAVNEGLPLGPTQISWFPRTPKTYWHMMMLIKYERAARYPWLPVWPDPPEPE